MINWTSVRTQGHCPMKSLIEPERTHGYVKQPPSFDGRICEQGVLFTLPPSVDGSLCLCSKSFPIHSLTHYSLDSVHDIVHYIGDEQTRIRTLRRTFLNVIYVSKCAGYLCGKTYAPHHVNKPGTHDESWRLY